MTTTRKRRSRPKPERLTIGKAHFVETVEILQYGTGAEYSVRVGDRFWADYDTREEAIAEANRLIGLNLVEWPEE